MITKLVEATNGANWGKFLVAQFTEEEWRYRSKVEANGRMPLLPSLGWGRREHQYFLLDVQTGEGALFSLDGPNAHFQLSDKHAIWCCPMYEPYLIWLNAWARERNFPAPTDLPALHTFGLEETREHTAMYGHRRQGRPDFYLVSRKNAGPQEVCELIVTAQSPTQALDVARHMAETEGWRSWNGATAELITPDADPRVISTKRRG